MNSKIIESIEMKTNTHIERVDGELQVQIVGSVEGNENPVLAKIMLRKHGVEGSITIKNLVE